MRTAPKTKHRPPTCVSYGSKGLFLGPCHMHIMLQCTPVPSFGPIAKSSTSITSRDGNHARTWPLYNGNVMVQREAVSIRGVLLSVVLSGVIVFFVSCCAVQTFVLLLGLSMDSVCLFDVDAGHSQVAVPRAPAHSLKHLVR